MAKRHRISVSQTDVRLACRSVLARGYCVFDRRRQISINWGSEFQKTAGKDVAARRWAVGICGAGGKLYFLATKIVRSRIRRDLNSRREAVRFSTEGVLAMSASARFTRK